MLNEKLHAWAIRRELGPAIASLRAGDKVSAEDREKLVASRGQETVLAGGIAVIPLRGMITPHGSLFSILFGGGSGGLQGFRQSLRQALNDSDITSIVIDVDSPGGLVDLVPETAAEIRDADKPIVAVSNVEAASAAYWLASQADELVVTPSGQVGSIGVFMVHDDWSGYNERIGIVPTYISAGRFKTEANPDEPLSEEARQALQAEVDHYYDMFVSDVAAGRGVSDADVRGGFGEGRMVNAAQAVADGMADRVASFEEVIADLVRNAGKPSLGSRALAEGGRIHITLEGEDLKKALEAHPSSSASEEKSTSTEDESSEEEAGDNASTEEDDDSEGEQQSAASRVFDVITN